jgi:formylglycine-generating enzyme required for sulfatase activity
LLLPLEVYKYAAPTEIDARYRAALDESMAIFTLEGAHRVPVAMRIDVAEALGRAGDPRLKPGVDNFIAVPGTGIKLCKYPVTIEEYLRFVEARGYEESKYWDAEGWGYKEKEGWTAPNGWDAQVTDAAPNRPVTGVSWYEANAYCRWQSEYKNATIRLPTDEEWSQAAIAPRGDNPWGEAERTSERLNFEGNVGRPTPVGIYPAGAGPAGHLDLTGNVWEWTATTTREDTYRVTRGGCWTNMAPFCLSRYAAGSFTYERGTHVGFRLAAGQ